MVRAVYKCRMCGNIIGSKLENSITRETASEMITKIISTERMADKSTMMLIHNCSNGSVGISDFIGIEMN